MVRPPPLSKGEFEDVSDMVEPALCSKWPLTAIDCWDLTRKKMCAIILQTETEVGNTNQFDEK